MNKDTHKEQKRVSELTLRLSSVRGFSLGANNPHFNKSLVSSCGSLLCLGVCPKVEELEG